MLSCKGCNKEHILSNILFWRQCGNILIHEGINLGCDVSLKFDRVKLWLGNEVIHQRKHSVSWRVTHPYKPFFLFFVLPCDFLVLTSGSTSQFFKFIHKIRFHLLQQHSMTYLSAWSAMIKMLFSQPLWNCLEFMKHIYI